MRVPAAGDFFFKLHVYCTLLLYIVVICTVHDPILTCTSHDMVRVCVCVHVRSSERVALGYHTE